MSSPHLLTSPHALVFLGLEERVLLLVNKGTEAAWWCAAFPFSIALAQETLLTKDSAIRIQRKAPKRCLCWAGQTEEVMNISFISQTLSYLLGLCRKRGLWHSWPMLGHSWMQSMGWCLAVMGQEGNTQHKVWKEAEDWMKEADLISEKQKGRKLRNPWCYSYFAEWKCIVKRKYVFSHN